MIYIVEETPQLEGSSAILKFWRGITVVREGREGRDIITYTIIGEGREGRTAEKSNTNAQMSLRNNAVQYLTFLSNSS